jgi:fatty-acyl-CoA synthase
VGRIKDLIIINGRNHWPQDLEWAVEQLPALRSGDSAAISVPGQSDEEIALLLVQCRLREIDEREALRKDIKDAIQHSVGIHTEVVFVPPRSLPKTSSGKLSRSKARTAFLAGELQGYDEHEAVSAKMSAA